MKHLRVLALTALGGYVAPGRADVLSYVTAVITDCSEPTETEATSAAATYDTQSYPDSVTYSMPTCDCGCPTCTYTSVYSTSYPILCPTGAGQQTYTITETYAGMSTSPTFAEPTGVPYGFTSYPATCTICGDEPITTVITCPSGGATYTTGTPTAASSTNAESGSSTVAGGSYAASSEAATGSSGGKGYDSAKPAPATTGKADAAATTHAAEEDDTTDTSTITKTLGQALAQGTSKAASTSAGHASSGASPQGTNVPVKVSGASATTIWLQPFAWTAVIIAAQLAR